ncbi:hypothetical protein C1646_767563 [Rhizophagus diaphanus]|nr:hypothetical protein C1646_767563 [Rhizophagus diaphanus] [Rhizophagus sp. MUCL 43196]
MNDDIRELKNRQPTPRTLDNTIFSYVVLEIVIEMDQIFDILEMINNSEIYISAAANLLIQCFKKNMFKQFFPNLSQNYIEILKDDEYYDITIEVGNNANIHLCGFISLNEQEPSEILKVLVAADQLLLQKLIDYLQTYLIENKSEWMEQYFELIYQAAFQSNSLLELQQYYDLQIKEIEICLY